ncbi:hypothetical protein [Ciceribacter ferrooxidans]|uniref:hypothetical protein n=1 Tax=Ciceribacter ferrooxidans TaxID=2509717 RepID=UPI0013EE0C5D|nr:hypothetical protein [Ciceribacter ferrooxidans]
MQKTQKQTNKNLKTLSPPRRLPVAAAPAGRIAGPAAWRPAVVRFSREEMRALVAEQID